MSGDAVGVGLIGCGTVARFHTAALRDVAASGVAIRGVAAADPSEENRRIVARNFAFDRYHDDWHRVVDDPDVDVVYVCTPTAMHREQCLAVLEAGKHLYAEKPIAPTLAEVAEIAAAARVAPVVSQVGFQTRFHALVSKARDLVASGELGAPMTYLWRDDEAFPTTSIESGYSDWRSHRDLAGGGVLLEHTIHGIDIVSWVFGRPVAVGARCRRTLGFDVEDTAVLRLDHATGVTGAVVGVYGETVGRTECRFEAHCRRGVVEVTWGGAVLVDEPALSMRVQRAGEPAEDLDPAVVLAEHLDRLGVGYTPFFWQEVAAIELFSAIAGGRSASPGFDDALVAHATVDAAYRSDARDGMTVPVTVP